jgi:hypothetical protein
LRANQTGSSNLLELQNTSTNVLSVTSTGVTLLKNSADSTAAFQIQNTSAVNLFTADTSGMIITIAGNTTTFASLTITNAHFKATQTNNLCTSGTCAVPTNCGTSPTAVVVANSTDSAGSFTITTGTGALGAGTCDTVIAFNKAYGAAPKAVILTPAAAVAAGKNIYISATATTSFTVKFNTAAAVNSEANTFYYWVVE